MARAAAALPARLHPERRRRAAVGVLRPALAGPGGAGRPGHDRRPDRAGGAGVRDPQHRRRRPLAEPRSGPRQHRLPLHLDRRRGRRRARGRRRRGPPGPLGARPHWGKLFGLEPELLRAQYPHLPAFTALATRLDPAGKLRNPFLDRHLPHPHLPS
ncbi:D-arabinono-1,4-lactone oxidase [Catellatospora coxensis]